MFCVLLTAGNTPAQDYAFKTFQKISELKIRPKNNFNLCLGATREKFSCYPSSGEWDTVINIQEIALNLTKEDVNLADDLLNDKVQKQIIDRYLGAVYYLGKGKRDAFLDNSCIPSDKPTSTALKSILPDTSVVDSRIAQLIEEEIVKTANFTFKGLLNANKLNNKAKLEAAFKSAFEKTIKGNASNKAEVKWIVARLQGDIDRISQFDSTKPCIDFARSKNGSIVTGIAGFLIMSSELSSDYVSTSSFDQAARIAFEATGETLTPVIDKAVVEAAFDWSSKTKRKITQSIQTNNRKPTFHPLWVSFARVN